MHTPVSEIYDSSDGAGRPDRDSSSLGSSGGDRWRPDFSVYGREVPGDYDTGEDQAGDYWGDQDPDAENYADIDAILARNDKLPEPRTRQEVAEEAGRADPDNASDHDQATDADLEGILHEYARLPEPPTGQQAAREDGVLDPAPTLIETGTELGGPLREEDPYLVAEHDDPGEFPGRADVGADTAERAAERDDTWR
jgi:hypothetical protein